MGLLQRSRVWIGEVWKAKHTSFASGKATTTSSTPAALTAGRRSSSSLRGRSRSITFACSWNWLVCYLSWHWSFLVGVLVFIVA